MLLFGDCVAICALERPCVFRGGVSRGVLARSWMTGSWESNGRFCDGDGVTVKELEGDASSLLDRSRGLFSSLRSVGVERRTVVECVVRCEPPTVAASSLSLHPESPFSRSRGHLRACVAVRGSEAALASLLGRPAWTDGPTELRSTRGLPKGLARGRKGGVAGIVSSSLISKP